MKKAFTILELLVVVAIIAILAVSAIPNFVGRIQDTEDAKYVAEIANVKKAADNYFIENGSYPTEQNLQPTEGYPMNLKFSLLVGGGYLTKLPSFSYWYIDYIGQVFHIQEKLENKKGLTLTDNKTGYKTPIANDYSLTLSHPESNHTEAPPETSTPILQKPIAAIGMAPNQSITTSTNITWTFDKSYSPDGRDIVADEWEGKQNVYTTPGTYTVKLRVKDSAEIWSEWEKVDIVVSLASFTPTVAGVSIEIDADAAASYLSVAKNEGKFELFTNRKKYKFDPLTDTLIEAVTNSFSTSRDVATTYDTAGNFWWAYSATSSSMWGYWAKTMPAGGNNFLSGRLALTNPYYGNIGLSSHKTQTKIAFTAMEQHDIKKLRFTEYKWDTAINQYKEEKRHTDHVAIGFTADALNGVPLYTSNGDLLLVYKIKPSTLYPNHIVVRKYTGDTSTYTEKIISAGVAFNSGFDISISAEEDSAGRIWVATQTEINSNSSAKWNLGYLVLNSDLTIHTPGKYLFGSTSNQAKYPKFITGDDGNMYMFYTVMGKLKYTKFTQ